MWKEGFLAPPASRPMQEVQEALETFGDIDDVVFNGAINGDLMTVWHRMLDVDLLRIVKLLHLPYEVLPVVKDGSKLVFVSSVAAEVAIKGMSASSATKAVLNSPNPHVCQSAIAAPLISVPVARLPRKTPT
ncbi:hypothetical protein AURDEDRAFT_165560 [Auricularia subglabra TFB-10046 SS5]|nr:hypothetical protein AURDEDRAFT_165560 [Auricularia subglabra TFB-10046 SS5]